MFSPLTGLKLILEVSTVSNYDISLFRKYEIL